jgi:hypothetical protein
VKSVTIVAVAVSVIERAVWPRAMWTKIFENMPPGHAATTIRPAASSGGSSKKRARAIPTSGIAMSCRIVPTIVAVGVRVTRWKSAMVSVSPMPNISENIATLWAWSTISAFKRRASRLGPIGEPRPIRRAYLLERHPASANRLS